MQHERATLPSQLPGHMRRMRNIFAYAALLFWAKKATKTKKKKAEEKVNKAK